LEVLNIKRENVARGGNQERKNDIVERKEKKRKEKEEKKGGRKWSSCHYKIVEKGDSGLSFWGGGPLTLIMPSQT
jgi:IS4 transposase